MNTNKPTPEQIETSIKEVINFLMNYEACNSWWTILCFNKYLQKKASLFIANKAIRKHRHYCEFLMAKAAKNEAIKQAA
jgi:hypothetical protein